ncbi:histone-like nucleoid-structuring protein Lsr2 [Paenarthrobacter nitroguajacolicus]
MVLSKRRGRSTCRSSEHRENPQAAPVPYNPVMALKRTIEILDDLDGTPDASPHEFSLDGVSYEIDLSEDNHRKLLSGLNPFIASARKIKPSAARRSLAPRTSNREELMRIREWANSNGFHVSPRGRVPQNIAGCTA